MVSRSVSKSVRFAVIQLLLLAVLNTGSLPVAAQGAQREATVVRVIDGDTVDVQFTDDRSTDRIRLIGIDTPEVVDPRKPVQCFGREASEHAHGLLDGQAVSVEKDASQGDRDIYGRLLSYLRLPDGRNFGQTMIADGYAHEYTYRLPYAYQDDFRAAQNDAMTNQLGLWSPGTCAGDTTQPANNVAADPPQIVVDAQPEPTLTSDFDPSRYIGLGNRFDCPAFASQAQAQAVLRADPRDPNRLDGDRDGIACEANPAPRDLAPVVR